MFDRGVVVEKRLNPRGRVGVFEVLLGEYQKAPLEGVEVGDQPDREAVGGVFLGPYQVVHREPAQDEGELGAQVEKGEARKRRRTHEDVAREQREVKQGREGEESPLGVPVLDAPELVGHHEGKRLRIERFEQGVGEDHLVTADLGDDGGVPPAGLLSRAQAVDAPKRNPGALEERPDAGGEGFVLQRLGPELKAQKKGLEGVEQPGKGSDQGEEDSRRRPGPGPHYCVGPAKEQRHQGHLDRPLLQLIEHPAGKRLAVRAQPELHPPGEVVQREVEERLPEEEGQGIKPGVPPTRSASFGPSGVSVQSAT